MRERGRGRGRADQLLSLALSHQRERGKILSSTCAVPERTTDKEHVMKSISRQAYADMFGPTVGDKVRLADTNL